VVLTRVHPLHAKGKGLVSDQIVTSPSGVCDDGVCRDECRAEGNDQEELREHGARIWEVRWS
jgi:hypothetical protein